MDKRFLNKVVNQIVSETRMDYDRKVIETPFFSLSSYSLLSRPSHQPSLFFLFTYHCRDVYGLNDNEIEYVWKEYKQIIKDKINSNG
tara:strand:- start:455 stop:715 length:261 start_codon:yes stop_codon:yes gene_type:complete